MNITVFHQGDAPRIFHELAEARLDYVDYNVGRGVTEANWAAGCFLLQEGAVNAAGGPSTPAVAVWDEQKRTLLWGATEQVVLDMLTNTIRNGTS